VYGSRVPSLARPRLTMYAAATHEAYREPSDASRSASPTYTATRIAAIAASVSRNSVVLKTHLGFRERSAPRVAIVGSARYAGDEVQVLGRH
jgi:hypothetical protein